MYSTATYLLWWMGSSFPFGASFLPKDSRRQLLICSCLLADNKGDEMQHISITVTFKSIENKPQAIFAIGPFDGLGKVKAWKTDFQNQLQAQNQEVLKLEWMSRISAELKTRETAIEGEHNWTPEQAIAHTLELFEAHNKR